MKITDVKACIIGGNFQWVMVKVETDEGITGIGEAYWGAGVCDVARHLKGQVVGENPLDVNRLHYKMMRGMSGAGSIGGTVVAAISGVEIALWDIAGKALNTPVYQLLGGKFRDRIRIYCDCHAGDQYTPEAYAKRAAEVKAMGYTALKFDIDVPTPYPRDSSNRNLSNAEIRYMASLAAAAREALGPDIDLAVDCHWRYDTKDAVRLGQALEGLDLLWFEDPTPPDNVEALARVKAEVSVPICTGENHYTKHMFKELIERGACDIVAPDIPKMGGLAEAMRVADLADTYYMPMAPHNVSSPLATLAAAHVCAAIPNFLCLEYHSVDLPWWEDSVLGDKPILDKGYLTVPEGRGLGVELNEELLRHHVVEGGEEFFG